MAHLECSAKKCASHSNPERDSLCRSRFRLSSGERVSPLTFGKRKQAMKRKAKSRSDVIIPGGVDEYIERMPESVRVRLREIRGAIQQAAPRSVETVSYFAMPGYSYAGYDYNGMFAWFSFKPPFVRLHVRPPVLEEHKEAAGDYPVTKAIISFPVDKPIPKPLVTKLAKASVAVMKQVGKNPGLRRKINRSKKTPNQSLQPPAPSRRG
jgi:uncharacterized protein YdhG (YjbR/CyaY superfamily)